MSRNHFSRPHCQPVLPLVYDDALSYYETLCKVIKRLNSIYDDTENMFLSILDDLGLSDTARHRLVLNVLDYGATGDGSTDDRAAIQEALNDAFDAGGGIVYLPAGHYITSKTLIIGENCFLIGSGASTIVDIIDTAPWWGVAVGVVGSNSGCCNMKILYYDYSEDPIVTGSAWGCIGVTNEAYYDAVAQGGSNVRPPIKNIIISDIYSEGHYSVQVEPITTISNVIYHNLFCDGSIVSLQANTKIDDLFEVGGEIYNVFADNIYCDYFRILDGTGHKASHIYVNGLKTHYIYSQGSDVHISNFIADCSSQSVMDPQITAFLDSAIQCYNYVSEDIEPERCSLTNGTIIGRASGVPSRGIGLIAASKWFFQDLSIHGFSLRNISGAVGSDCTWIGCDAAEAGITNSPTGTGISNNMGGSFIDFSTSWSSVYTDVSNVTDYQAEEGENLITFATGWRATGPADPETHIADLHETFIVKNGNLVYGNLMGYKYEGSPALRQAVATLPFPPAIDVFAIGFMIDSSTDDGPVAPCIFKVAKDTGVVRLWYAGQQTPSTFDACYFTFTYSHVSP